MGKGKVSGVFWVVLAALVLFVAGPAGALTLDDEGKYILGGYLENFTGLRLASHEYPGGDKVKSGDFEMFRNTLFMDFSARFSDAIQFKVIGRGYYDDVYSLNSKNEFVKDAEQWPGPNALDMKTDFDFREYYLTYSTGNLVVRGGRMQVVWGEADNVRMSDIINPLDISWYWSFPAWEEIRVPLYLMQMEYNVPHSRHHLRLEGVFNPGDFRPTQVAPYGATWDPGLPPEPVFSWIKEQQEHDLPDRDISNASGGARIKARLGKWDTSVFGYYQRFQDGVYSFDPAGALRPTDFPFKYHWPYVFTLGGTFNYVIGGTVIRGECAFNVDEPFQWKDSVIVTKQEQYGEADTFSFMLGFDRNDWFRFLNPGKTFYISGQWVQKFILSGEENVVTKLGDDGDNDSNTILSLLVNTEYWDGMIKPEAVGVWSVLEECGFVDFHIAYEPTYTWRFTLGLLGIWGNDLNAGIWGPVQDNSQVYGKIRWSF